MRGTLAIAWKDFRGIFFSPLFFTLAGLCTLVWSFMFNSRLNMFAQQSLQMMIQSRGQADGLNLHQSLFLPHISPVNLLLFLVIPAITMRLLSEEKKQRTYDLLLTSPVTATQIVAGKFLAGFGVAAALLMISFIYPVSVAFLADIQWAPLLTTYLGMLLLVSVYVSVGLFASSLTQSQFLSIIIAVILNTLLWFIGTGSDIFDSSFMKTLFEHLTVSEHLIAFVRGTIKITALVFFFSVSFFYCFLTQRVVESSRWR